MCSGKQLDFLTAHFFTVIEILSLKFVPKLTRLVYYAIQISGILFNSGDLEILTSILSFQKVWIMQFCCNVAIVI